MSLKAKSSGMPNTLLRDINAIHANIMLSDLPTEVQATIRQGVRTAFTRLLKEGYAISTGDVVPRAPLPRRENASRPAQPPRPPRRKDDGSGPPRRGPGGRNGPPKKV
jgi:hypothetical protein